MQYIFLAEEGEFTSCVPREPNIAHVAPERGVTWGYAATVLVICAKSYTFTGLYDDVMVHEGNVLCPLSLSKPLFTSRLLGHACRHHVSV